MSSALTPTTITAEVLGALGAALPPERLHSDELPIDTDLVQRLLAEQFPRWAELPIVPVPSGTDNVTFRLGHDMAVRMPRMASAASRLEKEIEWLPRLAPRLPVSVPVPLAAGEPSDGYPLPWAVTRWISGDDAARGRVGDLNKMALQLAGFVGELRNISAEAGPLPGEHTSGRGVPLASRDEPTRAAIAALDGVIDVELASEVWAAALAAPAWNRPPAWFHGDLHASNLLVRDGQLAGIIDFGCLGVGDPACDVMVAWTFLGAESPMLFRDAAGVDAATWARGRGWALSVGVIALPYYWGRDRVMSSMANQAISEALADHRREGRA